MNDKEREMLEAINAARAAWQRGPLRGDERLAAAAREHAEDMAAHPGLGHTGSDGSDGGQRIRRAGYVWTRWAEATGWGYDTGPMVAWWMQSPQHAPLLLDAGLTDIGAGYAAGGQNGNSWVVCLATGDAAAHDTTYMPIVLGGGG